MYRVVTDELVQQQIEALPVEALSAVAELRTLLEVQPSSGEPLHQKNPTVCRPSASACIARALRTT